MGARTMTPATLKPHLPLGVVAAGLAEGLGEDGDGRVDGVRDDADERLGAGVGDGLGEGRADAGVDLEEVVTAGCQLEVRLNHSRHAGLAGNTSGDDDNVGTGKGLLGTVVGGEEALNGSGGVDVREVGSNLHRVSVNWAFPIRCRVVVTGPPGVGGMAPGSGSGRGFHTYDDERLTPLALTTS